MRFLKHTVTRRKPPALDSYPTTSFPPQKSPFLITVRNDDSAFDNSDKMSADSASSRPISSGAPPERKRSNPCYVRRPTLKEILADQGPPPWTLEAFARYCEQNHCSENLEFIQDSERYKQKYLAMSRRHSDPNAGETHRPIMTRLSSMEFESLREMWTRLILLYIAPSSPRELNLPGKVRNDLVSIERSHAPTPPDHLQPAVTKIYELIEDSILFTFLNDVRPPDTDSDSLEGGMEKSAPTKLKDPPQPASDPTNTFSPTKRPPKVGNSHLSHSRPNSHASTKASQSSTTVDDMGPNSPSLMSSLAGESNRSSPGLASPASSANHLQTPPETPGGSENQRRTANRRKNDAPWKRMSAALGFKKKSGRSLKDLPEGGTTSDDDGRA